MHNDKEATTPPHMKEDLIQCIQNLKKLLRHKKHLETQYNWQKNARPSHPPPW